MSQLHILGLVGFFKKSWNTIHVVYFRKALGTSTSKIMIPGVKYKNVQNLICLNFKFLGWVNFPLSNATLRRSHGLSARKVQRTKSSRPEGPPTRSWGPTGHISLQFLYHLVNLTTEGILMQRFKLRLIKSFACRLEPAQEVNGKPLLGPYLT